MTTIRQTASGSAKIELTERDQYNDYSVVCEYQLHVNDPKAGYFRRFDLGTNKAKAINAYNNALATIRHAQTQAAS